MMNDKNTLIHKLDKQTAKSQAFTSSRWITCGGGLRELRGLGELGG